MSIGDGQRAVALQNSMMAAMLHADSEKPQVVRLPGKVNAVRKFMRHLSKEGTPRTCYGASGAGYTLQSTLDPDGFHYEVMAPSLIPWTPSGRHRCMRHHVV
jgi:hypothetical protein